MTLSAFTDLDLLDELEERGWPYLQRLVPIVRSILLVRRGKVLDEEVADERARNLVGQLMEILR